MDRQTILRALEHHPVIPAVRSQQALEQALISPVAAVFLISSSILTLEETVDSCRVERLGVDGVISTRPSLLKAASELGALTVQRLFLMDSTSFDHGVRLLKANPPDRAEIMPGIAPKAIRERLLSYLSEQAMENGGPHFTIPFSRQQLADYLGVDRSALSNELSKMQRDGLISCRKNEFTLNEGARAE